MTAIEKNIKLTLTRMQEEIIKIESTKSPGLIDIYDNVFYFDPNAQIIEYKGIREGGSLRPISSYEGALLLTEIPTQYAVSVVPEIAREATSSAGKFAIQFDYHNQQLEPSFDDCYLNANLDRIKNRLLVSYDMAMQMGWRVNISDINKAIIRNPSGEIS